MYSATNVVADVLTIDPGAGALLTYEKMVIKSFQGELFVPIFFSTPLCSIVKLGSLASVP